MVREKGKNAVRRGEAGYNLVVLIIAITVLTIMLAAMLPLVSQEIRRDKEEELVFRGFQYAEAIRVFQMRYQRLPNKLSELIEVKPRSIRQLWKDPMTDDGKWGLIFLNQGQPQQNPSPDPQINPQNQQPEPQGGDQEGPDQQPGLQTPKKGDVVQTGPIVGVYSKSHQKSILIFNGRERYDEWRFTVDMLGGQIQTIEGRPAGASGFTFSTRWIGRPMRYFNQGMPPGVQNGTMPGAGKPGSGQPGGKPVPGQPPPKPKPFGRP